MIAQRLMRRLCPICRTQQLWSELARGLEAHFTLEERALFPRYAHFDATETRALAVQLLGEGAEDVLARLTTEGEG